MPVEWNDLTPQEAVDRLNLNSPHMKARLGRKGDEELSETLIHSVPRSTQSNKNTPKKRSKSTIYYRVSPANEALVFAWKESAEYISKIHNALKAKTWGELKKKLPPEEYDWIIDARSNYTSYREKPRLKSSDPFYAYDDVPGYADGDYPTWLQQEQEFCLPNEILYKYAIHKWTTLNGDYYRIEKEHEEAICRDLRALGFNVIKRDDVYFY